MSCANRDGTKPTWENSRKQRKILAELTERSHQQNAKNRGT